MEYLCCCRCIYDTEEKNIKKSIVKLTDIIVSSSSNIEETANVEAESNANAKSNAKSNAVEAIDDDEFNIVTNEDYGDIQPSTENASNNNNNKIIFASSSIKDYFKKD
jgi:hypothetical protein